MRRPPTRRELLLTGVAGALLAPAPAAAATTSTTTSGAADAAPFSETDRLERLIRLELLLLFAYQHILASDVLTPRAHRTLAPFAAHEEAHIKALRRPLLARGGTMPAPPRSIAEANRHLGHRKIGGRLGHLQGDPDAIRLLLTLEQVTIGAYFVALMKLQDPEVIVLASSIMGNEAQHDAMLALLFPKETARQAVPYGLVQGLQ
jgi:hypothetical protein